MLSHALFNFYYGSSINFFLFPEIPVFYGKTKAFPVLLDVLNKIITLFSHILRFDFFTHLFYNEIEIKSHLFSYCEI